MSDPHHEEHLDLIAKIHNVGWIAAEDQITTLGHRIRFRDAPYTSDWDGMQTRYAVGKTYIEALQSFWEELERERDSGRDTVAGN
jgi:hypothetical protein